MENSDEEQANVTSNRWFKKRIMPVIHDDCNVVLRYLQRYNQMKPVGNPETFAHSTMLNCEFASLQIARSLVSNSAASLADRASAMSFVVGYTIIYPYTVTNINLDDLKWLFEEDTADFSNAKGLHDRLEISRLARVVAMSDLLWKDTKESVEQALAKIIQDVQIMQPLSLNKQSAVVDAADLCMRVLRILLSRLPGQIE